MSDRTVPAAPGPALLRFSPQLAVLALASALAWALTAYLTTVMGNGPGVMGLGPASFLGIWALMMTAMMLPSVAPLAAFYSRGVRTHRPLRLAAFSAGYLAVWALVGIPAYVLMRLGGGVAGGHPVLARIGAAVLLACAGLWQFSGAKDFCLVRCRSPIGLLLNYGSYRGALRDVRAAVHHAAFCLGCCWALMTLFVVFGMMNLPAMLAIAAVVLLEKLASGERVIARLVGLACLVMAVVVTVVPSIAAGLNGSPMPIS